MIWLWVPFMIVSGAIPLCAQQTPQAPMAYNIRTGEKTPLLPDEARADVAWGRAHCSFRRIRVRHRGGSPGALPSSMRNCR